MCFKISCNLRSRFWQALKNNQKAGHTIELIGCTIEEVKYLLESKWTEGMNWDNYGKGGWDIDHIIPLSSFDLTDPEQQKKACHYTNLQPLWHIDNIKKGDKTN